MLSEISRPKNVAISLCEMVQPHRNLWDPQDASYSKHKLRQKHFGDLAQELCQKHPEMSITGGKFIYNSSAGLG